MSIKQEFTAFGYSIEKSRLSMGHFSFFGDL